MQADRLPGRKIEQIGAGAAWHGRAIMGYPAAVHAHDLSGGTAFGVEDVAVNAKQRFKIVVSAIRTWVSDGGDGEIWRGIGGGKLDRSGRRSVSTSRHSQETEGEKSERADIDDVEDPETARRGLGEVPWAAACAPFLR